MMFLGESGPDMIHAVKMETKVTTKGTTTIPEPCRKELGISAGTIISWKVRGGKLVGEKRADTANALQAHIRRYSGAWKGASKALKKTRGRDV
jgi:bifunctional DNA-binding transcriptional regulator/antitoxin component of YhaV-PrlF toxin-antitoxin module